MVTLLVFIEKCKPLGYAKLELGLGEKFLYIFKINSINYKFIIRN